MHEVRVFDGGDKPLIVVKKDSQESATNFAVFIVRGEEATWRAEVWGPDGKRVHTAYP